LEAGVALADDAPTLAPVLDALHLTCLAQARLLRLHAERVDFWLDEPLVGTLHAGRGFDLDAARAWYARLADACGDRVRLGVHSCAGFDPILVELGVPVVSCIAGLGTGDHAAAIRRQLEHGFMAWGVVPTGADAPVSVATVTSRIDACIAGLGFEPEHVATRSLLTPDCGLAGLDAAAGIERLRLLREAAAGLRARSRLR
jgi:methionine synthase II (cobalamin-independent)